MSDFDPSGHSVATDEDARFVFAEWDRRARSRDVPDLLEARGAVRRQADPADRRIKVLIITDEGCRVRDNFWSGMVASAGPFAQLSGRQVRQLRDLLRLVAPATH